MPTGPASAFIEDSRVKKTKCYDRSWDVKGDELFVDSELVGKLDFGKSRYFFKNRKYGQLYYAYIGDRYFVFRECNRVGYVAPAAHTLSKMPIAAESDDED